MRHTLPRRVVVLATAVAGVVTGHMAAYAVAIPNGTARAAELHTTGHGYWGGAVLAAGGATVLALLVSGWRAAHRVEANVRLVPLAAGQLALFALAEGSERLAAGVPLASLLHAPEFALGLLLQVAVAIAAVVILRRWSALVATVAAAPVARASDPAGLPLASAVERVAASAPRTPVRTRGPPLLAAA